jgi:hypothetical protein
MFSSKKSDIRLKGVNVGKHPDQYERIRIFMLFGTSGIIRLMQMVISRQLIYTASVIMIPVFLAFGSVNGHAEVTEDYSRLIDLILLDDQQQPLYVFNDFEEEFDTASHRATRQYFKENPGLIQRIKDKLKGGKLRWKLKNLKHRLLFVPENRTEYATLYKDYCLDVIRAILDKT